MNISLKKALSSENILLESLKYNPKKRKIYVNGHHINFIEVGTGEVLLLIHGATIGWGQWFQNISELAKYYKVYAIDLPGSGLSERINFNKDNLENAWVKTVEEFIKTLNLKNVSIIGHSFGGWVGAKIAARLPGILNKVVLVNTIGIKQKISLKERLLALPITPGLLTYLTLGSREESTEKFLLGVIHRPDYKYDIRFVNYVHNMRLLPNTQSLFHLIGSTVNLMGLKKELLLTEQLHKITSPTLIIWGENDPSLPVSIAKQTHKLIPISRLLLYPNVGHVPNLEDSTRFNTDVLKFLKD